MLINLRSHVRRLELLQIHVLVTVTMPYVSTLLCVGGLLGTMHVGTELQLQSHRRPASHLSRWGKKLRTSGEVDKILNVGWQLRLYLLVGILGSFEHQKQHSLLGGNAAVAWVVGTIVIYLEH